MPESAIAQSTELAAKLDAEWAAFANAAQRLRDETAATLDALIAETEQAFERLRQAHAVTRELDDEQAAKVLRRVRERAGRRPVGFDLSGHAAEEVPR